MIVPCVALFSDSNTDDHRAAYIKNFKDEIYCNRFVSILQLYDAS